MAITTETVYLGQLRTRMTHLQSGNAIITDAPLDNNGRGEYFSPTDLVASALGSCILTIMGMAAGTHGFDIDGTQLKIEKIMASSPRRIGGIVIDFYFPKDYEPKVKRILELTAKECPVARSLHPDLKQTIRFHYSK